MLPIFSWNDTRFSKGSELRLRMHRRVIWGPIAAGKANSGLKIIINVSVPSLFPSFRQI
jgi:hypothetical protein